MGTSSALCASGYKGQEGAHGRERRGLFGQQHCCFYRPAYLRHHQWVPVSGGETGHRTDGATSVLATLEELAFVWEEGHKLELSTKQCSG